MTKRYEDSRYVIHEYISARGDRQFILSQRAGFIYLGESATLAGALTLRAVEADKERERVAYERMIEREEGR